ncbi:MAG TPA: hypothetical protein VLX44_00390 [Xanthobacteraceae bacterium]|nr:hypothetical protein [Xanthobacteraceae bacterium]
MPPDEVFILRFWLEEAGMEERMRWRGQVRSVNTRHRQIADDIDSAFALIATRLRAALSAEKEHQK